jgi:hypothetical protein
MEDMEDMQEDEGYHHNFPSFPASLIPISKLQTLV